MSFVCPLMTAAWEMSEGNHGGETRHQQPRVSGQITVSRRISEAVKGQGGDEGRGRHHGDHRFASAVKRGFCSGSATV